jgi:uncharacterized repeat protein (TIGR01451 family)
MLRTTTLLLLLLGATAARALTATVNVRPETCGNVNGAAWGGGSGGQAPYTLEWTGPGGFTATGDSIFGLEAGTYTLTVTDDLGAIATADGVVQDLQQLVAGMGPTWAGAASVTGYWGGACAGQCNGAGAFVDDISSGTAPFSYSFNVSNTYLGLNADGWPVHSGFCYGEDVSYTMTDALGCTGTGQFGVYGVDATWYPWLSDIQGSCSGGNGGSVTALTIDFWPHTLILRLDGAVVDSQVSIAGPTLYFTDLAPGDYELEAVYTGTQCQHAQYFTIPDLGTNCADVSGTSWYDVDGDCVQDAGEVGIPNSVLAIEPGGYYAITHADGSYTLNLPAGNYTLAQTDGTLVPICPATQPVPFTINSLPMTIDLANGSTEELDLVVNTSSGFARPGFDYQLHAQVGNSSPQVSGPVTVTCTYDPLLTFVSVSPTPTSMVGNTITWDFPAFGSFGAASMHATLNVPVPTPLGTVLSSTFTASNTLTETTLANNTAVETRTVTGSYDPNVKEVRTSSQQSTTQYFVDVDQYLDYTIHFQNTGTDTAFTVVVTDTLDAALDMASFQQGASSHTCTVDFLTDRVVRWTFPNILLVDSTTNEPASHGLTRFRIRLHEPVVPGVILANAADIFFDFNPPIRTPDAVVVTDLSTAVGTIATEDLRLVPNPAQERLTLVGPLRALSARVLGTDGRLVLEQAVVTNTLDIGTLAAGSYVVQVRMADGAVRAVRLVKQ